MQRNKQFYCTIKPGMVWINAINLDSVAWIYELPVMLKDDTTNEERKGKRTDKMPTLRKIKRAAKPSTSRHNLQHI